LGQSDCQGTIIVSLTRHVSIYFKFLKIDFFKALFVVFKIIVFKNICHLLKLIYYKLINM